MSSPTKHCKFFNSAKGCNNGDGCKYLHKINEEVKIALPCTALALDIECSGLWIGVHKIVAIGASVFQLNQHHQIVELESRVFKFQVNYPEDFHEDTLRDFWHVDNRMEILTDLQRDAKPADEAIADFYDFYRSVCHRYPLFYMVTDNPLVDVGFINLLITTKLGRPPLTHRPLPPSLVFTKGHLVELPAIFDDSHLAPPVHSSLSSSSSSSLFSAFSPLSPLISDVRVREEPRQELEERYSHPHFPIDVNSFACGLIGLHLPPHRREMGSRWASPLDYLNYHKPYLVCPYKKTHYPEDDAKFACWQFLQCMSILWTEEYERLHSSGASGSGSARSSPKCLSSHYSKNNPNHSIISGGGGGGGSNCNSPLARRATPKIAAHSPSPLRESCNGSGGDSGGITFDESSFPAFLPMSPVTLPPRKRAHSGSGGSCSSSPFAISTKFSIAGSPIPSLHTHHLHSQHHQGIPSSPRSPRTLSPRK